MIERKKKRRAYRVLPAGAYALQGRCTPFLFLKRGKGKTWDQLLQFPDIVTRAREEWPVWTSKPDPDQLPETVALIPGCSILPFGVHEGMKVEQIG